MQNLLMLIQVADSTAVAEGAAKSISVWQILMKGSSGLGLPFMLMLFILSIAAIYIFGSRFWKIDRAGKVDPNFMDRIQQFMLNGNMQAALDLCRNSDTPIARMVEKGIRRIGKPLRSIEVAIENVGQVELLKLEKNLANLATIAGAAPMIGFLGTVTGMITAFYNLSEAGSNIETNMLAEGIYQALVTTATGLFIGIMAYIGYNILVSKVSKVIYEMEFSTLEFIDFLQEPAN